MFFAIDVRERLILKTAAKAQPGRANIPEKAEYGLNRVCFLQNQSKEK